MQLHVPQDYASVHEVEQIMGVDNMIVSPQANKPIMGMFQDSQLGTFILTQPGYTVPKAQFMDCVFTAEGFNVNRPQFGYIDRYLLQIKKMVPEKDYYLGTTLFSVLLPQDFEYTTKEVTIKNGILLKGVIGKREVGKSYGSIHHRLFKEYSQERADEFLTALQFIINRFLIYRGFSTGMTDFIVSPEIKNSVRESIQKAYIELEALKETESDPRLLEFKTVNILNSAGTGIKELLHENPMENQLETMIVSGSKGNIQNIKQIKAFLGQNTVEGKRIRPEIDNGKRTLPCFSRENSDCPAARGFIESAFIDGLSPEEMWFHTEAGREGVISTAVGTKESGYAERKLMKRLEELVVENDYSIRNSMGNIIQFVYGGDNLNPTWFLNGDCSFVNVQNLAQRLNCC